MNPQLQVWKLISKSLKKNIPVILLYVLESKGSSPGRKGFLMAVNAKEKFSGSIGGGIMEYKLVEMAKSLLEKGERNKADIKKQEHKKTGNSQSGMICSGEQTVLLLSVNHHDLSAIKKIIKAYKNFKSGVLQLSNSGVRFFKTNVNLQEIFVQRSENDWVSIQKIGYVDRVCIIGGGHCSLALSRTMRELGFYVQVVDTRGNLNTMKKNKYAHKKSVIGDYSEVKNLVEGERNFVVIMTFGYRTDDEVFRSVYKENFKYLAMLGSKNKISKMKETYIKEGLLQIDGSLLNGKILFSPAGIEIKSKTPGEIAISIAAEIITVKNKE
ncbi:MAG: XdhC family protein [Ginsengibacter sp.]